MGAARVLSRIDEFPERDGGGEFRLTWRTTKIVERSERTVDGSFAVYSAPEVKEEIETLRYADDAERARHIRINDLLK